MPPSAPTPVAGFPAEKHLSPEARAAVREAIRLAGGNEVFFLGRADGPLVTAVEDFCRGNAHMVPVLRRVARGWDVAIHNHPSGDLTPSDPDLSVAAELGDMGLGFFIVDNAAERVNPVVKIVPKEAPPAPLDVSTLGRALGAGGPVAGLLGLDYESRPEQERMASAVMEALAGSGIAAIEAGTGTGKSLAYLVPALLRALRAKERIVVSTATIALQEQLVRKDIPLLRKAWPGIAALANLPSPGEGKPLPEPLQLKALEPPRAVLMKGRSNYVCLRKVEDVEGGLAEVCESEAEQEEVRLLAAWARKTREGTREELPALPTSGAWEKVSVEADTCTRTACRFYQDCHYFKARREAAAADLVVVNHHLLLSDLAVRRAVGWKGGAVLPPYRHLVLDEAHHLEDVAAEHLGDQATTTGIRRALGRLLSSRRVSKGLLPALVSKLLEIGGETCAQVAATLEEKAIPARHNVDSALEMLSDAAAWFLQTVGARDEGSGRERGPGEPEPPLTLRIKREHRDRPEWVRLEVEARELAGRLASLAQTVEQGLRPLEDLEKPELQWLVLEANAAAHRIASASSSVLAFVDLPENDDGDVRWIERRKPKGGRDGILALRRAPREVAATLAKELYPNVAGVVMTSATLAVSKGFDYFSSRTGIDRAAPLEGGRDPRLTTLRLPSPFDYARQSVLAIPRDLPDPSDRAYDDASAKALLDAAAASGGRAFFLFTSYRALEKAWRALERPLRELGFSVMRQGEASRPRLVERFKREAPAVLFGTDSFWEGVDAGGGALRLVAIQRLPFRVPSEPLQEARAEAIQSRGGDAFTELTLPQAILKLKQGFGRLIRSRQDRGAILILDRRVLVKQYGRLFLESLPPARRVTGTSAEVIAAIREVCSEERRALAP